MDVVEAPRLTPQIVAEHGLSDEEYARILKPMGREPNLVELGIFSVMWSEHCSYKSSRIHLNQLPTKASAAMASASAAPRSRPRSISIPPTTATSSSTR